MTDRREEDIKFLKTTRIEALSDGIFAIAMTILVLSFESIFEKPIPGISEQYFFKQLMEYWPDLLHYMESFLILGAFWYQHHRQFHFIKKVDVVALFINIVGLMLVGLIPFSTVMLSDYGHIRPAALLFELNMFAAGLAFYIHWLYVSYRNRFIDEDAPKDTILYYRKRLLIMPVVSVVAAAVSLFSSRGGTVIFFAVPFLLIFWKPKKV